MKRALLVIVGLMLAAYGLVYVVNHFDDFDFDGANAAKKKQVDEWNRRLQDGDKTLGLPSVMPELKGIPDNHDDEEKWMQRIEAEVLKERAQKKSGEGK